MNTGDAPSATPTAGGALWYQHPWPCVPDVPRTLGVPTRRNVECVSHIAHTLRNVLETPTTRQGHSHIAHRTNESTHMLITSSNILSTTVQFHVNTDGTWTAVAGTSTIARGDSLKQVRRLARMELRKKQIRVAVPYTHLNPTTNEFYSAIARGRHAQHRYRILTWIDDGSENGHNSYIDGYGYSGRTTQVLQPDIPEKDIKRLKYLFERRAKLRQLTEQCEELIEKWKADHTFDLAKAVDEAITEAAQNPPVSTDEDTDADFLNGDTDSDRERADLLAAIDFADEDD